MSILNPYQHDKAYLEAEKPLSPVRGWQAFLSLDYEFDKNRTRLTRRRHAGPLAVQKVLYPEGCELCHTMILHPPGGMAGGDELSIDINLAAGAKTLVTTPGAGKWYRSAGDVSSQKLTLTVKNGAALEWFPQENILFNGANVQMTTDIYLSAQSRFMGWDILCLGRPACRETFQQGRLAQTTAIYREERLIWHEQGHLAGSDPLLKSAIGLSQYPVAGIFWMAGAAIASETLTRLREVTLTGDGHVGVTALPDIFIGRYLGDSTEQARTYLETLWHILRPVVLERPAMTPRIWKT